MNVRGGVVWGINGPEKVYPTRVEIVTESAEPPENVVFYTIKTTKKMRFLCVYPWNPLIRAKHQRSFILPPSIQAQGQHHHV